MKAHKINEQKWDLIVKECQRPQKKKKTLKSEFIKSAEKTLIGYFKNGGLKLQLGF